MRQPSTASHAGRGCIGQTARCSSTSTAPPRAGTENATTLAVADGDGSLWRTFVGSASAGKSATACTTLSACDSENSTIAGPGSIGDSPIATERTGARMADGCSARSSGSTSGHWQFSASSRPRARKAATRCRPAARSAAATSGFSHRHGTPAASAASRPARWPATGAATTSASTARASAMASAAAATGWPSSAAISPAARTPPAASRPATAATVAPAASKARARKGPVPCRDRPAPTMPTRSGAAGGRSVGAGTVISRGEPRSLRHERPRRPPRVFAPGGSRPILVESTDSPAVVRFAPAAHPRTGSARVPLHGLRSGHPFRFACPHCLRDGGSGGILRQHATCCHECALWGLYRLVRRNRGAHRIPAAAPRQAADFGKPKRKKTARPAPTGRADFFWPVARAAGGRCGPPHPPCGRRPHRRYARCRWPPARSPPVAAAHG
jgi:hypothetical protein